MVHHIKSIFIKFSWKVPWKQSLILNQFRIYLVNKTMLAAKFELNMEHSLSSNCPLCSTFAYAMLTVESCCKVILLQFSRLVLHWRKSKSLSCFSNFRIMARAISEVVTQFPCKKGGPDPPWRNTVYNPRNWFLTECPNEHKIIFKILSLEKLR